MEPGFVPWLVVFAGKEDCVSRCDEPPSGELLKAFGEFNREDWFACHETLEELWSGSSGEMRNFYQGTLQLAVALHHWRNGNFNGARLLLGSAVDYLKRVGKKCQRIDVAALISAADRFREIMVSLGPGRMADIDVTLIPKMQLADSPST